MQSPPVNKGRIYWGGLFLVLAVAGLLYQFLVARHLEQTSALFMGVAAVLALGLSLLPVSKSVTGEIVLGTMVALVLSMLLYHEGAVCILMSTPLFLSFAVAVGRVVSFAKTKAGKTRMRVVLVFIFLPLSLEGVTEQLSFDRDETVTVSRLVTVPPELIERKLARMPDLSKILPPFLRLGFPEPQSASGEDLKVGSQRCFHVPARENLSGDVCWKIARRSAHHVLFQLVKDESKIAHWMTWRTANVAWSAEGDGQTRVVVTLKFWRELDPAWYFSPLERYAVGLTGEYLIDAYLGQ